MVETDWQNSINDKVDGKFVHHLGMVKAIWHRHSTTIAGDPQPFVFRIQGRDNFKCLGHPSYSCHVEAAHHIRRCKLLIVAFIVLPS